MIDFTKVEFETSFGNAAQLFASDRPEIVFTGRSNVGKSSLINKLCNRKALAKVGSTPGKTQTINFYRHDGFRLVDLPGYGYAARAQSQRDDWGRLIEYYFNSGRSISLAVALVDIRHEPTDLDKVMFEFLFKTGIPFTVCATKADKLKKAELSAFKAKFPMIPQGEIFAFSAENGMGLDFLKKEIEQAICGE